MKAKREARENVLKSVSCVSETKNSFIKLKEIVPVTKMNNLSSSSNEVATNTTSSNTKVKNKPNSSRFMNIRESRRLTALSSVDFASPKSGAAYSVKKQNLLAAVGNKTLKFGVKASLNGNSFFEKAPMKKDLTHRRRLPLKSPIAPENFSSTFSKLKSEADNLKIY